MTMVETMLTSLAFYNTDRVESHPDGASRAQVGYHFTCLCGKKAIIIVGYGGIRRHKKEDYCLNLLSIVSSTWTVSIIHSFSIMLIVIGLGL